MTDDDYMAALTILRKAKVPHAAHFSCIVTDYAKVTTVQGARDSVKAHRSRKGK